MDSALKVHLVKKQKYLAPLLEAMNVILIPPKRPRYRVHGPLEQHVAYPRFPSNVHPLVHQTTPAPQQAVGLVLHLHRHHRHRDQGPDYGTPHAESWICR